MARISNHLTFTWAIENITMAKNLPNDGIIDSPTFTANDTNDEYEIKWFIRIQVVNFTPQCCSLHIFLMAASETSVSFAGYRITTRDTVGNCRHYKRRFPQKITNEEEVGVLEYPIMNYITDFNKYPLITDALKITCYFVLDEKEEIKRVSEDFDLQKLSVDFSSLFKSGQFSDVHIIAGNEVFKVHKVILHARCPAMLKDLKKDESGASIVDTISVDIEVPILKALLLYLYSGKISPNNHSLDGLYNVVQKYELNSLRKQICFAPKVISAHTVIETTRQCLIWPIRNFSSVKRLREMYSPVADIGSESFQLALFCTERLDSYDCIQISINRISKDTTKELWSTCTILMIGAEVEEETLKSYNYKYKTERNWKLPAFIIKKCPRGAKDKSLSDDTLTVRCDLAISHGEITSSLEEALFRAESYSQRFCDLEKLSIDMALICSGVFSQEAVFTDISVISRKDTFPAHKCILVARSSELALKFDLKLNQLPAKELDLSFVDPLTVCKVIQCAYTGKTSVKSYNECLALYTSAGKKEMIALREKYSAALKICQQLEEIVEILMFASTSNDEGLKVQARKHIADNPLEILRSKEWMKLLRQNPELVNEVFVCMANRYKSVILSESQSLS